MLVAYFDESYNHPPEGSEAPRLYTVGCGLSTKEDWIKLGVRWRSALRRKPIIEYFHMTDFENRIGPYRDWPEQVRLERLRRLHAIMRDHIKYSISATISRDDFDSVTVRLRRHKKQPQLDYYLFGTIVCMDAIASWRRRNKNNELVDYVFSSLSKQGSLLDLWFSHCLGDPELKKRYGMTGQWSKGIMKHVPELQAADIIAYELNKRAVSWQTDEFAATRESLINLGLTQDNSEPRFYGQEEIANIFANPSIGSFDPDKEKQE